MKREKQNMIKSENGQTAYFPIAVGWPQDTFSQTPKSLRSPENRRKKNLHKKMIKRMKRPLRARAQLGELSWFDCLHC